MAMIQRKILTELLEAASEYPVVTVVGPRQSGKTTLVRAACPDRAYISLEDPEVRLNAQTDPRGFLADLQNGAILDEIQRTPVLLSYIQGIVDQSKRRGLFILTGSHQPLLHEAVSQSLAGRTAMLNLLPFSFKELQTYQSWTDPYDLILKGGYPRLHDEHLKPERFFNSYVQTYLERDVRALINLKDLTRFQRFLVLLAGRTGQIVNYSSLSNDVGVSSNTIKEWISVLKASYVVYELPPFFENIRKRMIKSPKLYFIDTGLACHFLGIQTAGQVKRDPLRGSLFENWLVMDIIKGLQNQGMHPDLYFYRDSHGHEVDLIMRRARQCLPVEIKSASTFDSDFVKGLNQFQNSGVNNVLPGMVLYNGDLDFTNHDVRVFNYIKHGGFESLHSK